MTKDTKVWLIGSGAAIAVGSFLPWVSTGLFSISGTSGDGTLTLIFGALIAVIGVLGKTSKVLGLGVVGLAVLSALIAWNAFSGLTDVDAGLMTVAPGGGLYLVGLGALFAAIAGMKLWSEATTVTVQEAAGENEADVP